MKYRLIVDGGVEVQTDNEVLALAGFQAAIERQLSEAGEHDLKDGDFESEISLMENTDKLTFKLTYESGEDE